MKTQIDKERFGPVALITGASSGIGREFARQNKKRTAVNACSVERRKEHLRGNRSSQPAHRDKNCSALGSGESLERSGKTSSRLHPRLNH
jgi:NADP-dependent 3-hydroxy acid dehydrogenase YdfG